MNQYNNATFDYPFPTFSDLGWFENSIDVDRMMLMQAGWCNDYANPKLDDIVKEIRDECSAIENNAAMV
jgi:hypothetical protein